MTHGNLPQPSQSELTILRVLWRRGPSTVRQVHDALGSGRRRRYTTTLKQMQLMAEKGMLERDQTQRSHVYSAVIDQRSTEQSLVGSFIDRVFEGSTRKMVLHALAAREVTDQELAEITRIIGQLEKRE